MASTRVNSASTSDHTGAPWAGQEPERDGVADPETLRPSGPSASASHARPVGPLTEGLRLGSLKWKLLVNTLTRSTWILVGTILGGLYILFMGGMIAVGLFFLANESLEAIVTTAVLGGAVVILAWWLFPIVTSKADASLDPSRLALFPLRIPGIQLGQILGAVISIPGAATLLLALGWVTSWRFSAVALAVAVPSVLLGLLLAFTGSRTVTALSASLSKHRRVGEIASIIFLVLMMLLGPIFIGLGQGLEQVWEQLPTWASYLAWTPLGAVWAMPADAAQGQWLEALARLAITVVSIVVLLFVWRFALRRALSEATGGAARSGSKTVSGAGLLDRLPATAWGAVLARSLIYWVKDPRYTASLVIYPAMGVLIWFLSEQSGTGLMWAYPAVIALFMAYTIAADVAYDNTAFSLHILSGVSGRDDRLGRAIGLIIVTIPLVLFGLALAIVRTQDWHLLPGVIGLCAALLLAGTGVASVLSARYTFPVAPPGASPMKTPQGFTILNMLLQFVIMAVVFVMGLPQLILIIVQVVSGDMMWGWIALAVGIVEGLVILWLGIVVGGKWLERRAPELLQEVAQYR
ncbi:hypothetical protein [Kocuria atrinae]|uniref:Transporter n=1 Tax=Kocuria atrinae TaxID=592377 RepID=A0ABN2XCZ7_9MICC